jgi:hypothetical protein
MSDGGDVPYAPFPVVGRVAFGPGGAHASRSASTPDAAAKLRLADWDALKHENARLRVLLPNLRSTIEACIHALRSYQHGNASPDLAKNVADAAEQMLKEAK